MKWYGNYGRNISRTVIRFGKYGRKYWKDMENTEENNEKIQKIWKKIVKRYGKYGRKVSRIVIRYGQYGRKLWNDMENIEERQVE